MSSAIKNRENKQEFGRYLLVGCSTTIVNVVIYHLLVLVGIEYWFANAIAIILAKIYAYITNKYIVFRTKCRTIRETIQEVLSFIMARGSTGLLDYFGLIFAVEILGRDKVLSKYFIQCIVIVLNYVMGRFLVFRKRETTSSDKEKS